jgi:hypothetical protein
MKSSPYLLAALFSLPAAGFAQALDVKPGLWEHSVNLKTASGRLEQALEMARTQIALLPPAQRQMMENMLAQQGIKFDIVNQSFQNCITEEEAASGKFTFAEEGGCAQTSVTQDGNATHVSFVCDGGQGELVMQDGTSYTGSSSMTLDFNGDKEQATATHSGRWLGASCAAAGL